jgi:c-di-GMP-binding flagellar brake protein YcgR
MSEDQGGFDQYLEPGLIVSVRAESKREVAAVVSAVVEDLISLEMVPNGSEPTFQEGEQVKLRYWDQDATAYHWSAEVGKLFPKQNLLTLSTEGAGVVQRRRSYRVMTPIPFSMTIIESAETELIGQHVPDLKTKNLSIDGLLFQSELQLKAKDKVGIDLNLAQELNAVGWVVRSEPQGAGVNLVAVMFLMLNKEEQRQLVQLIGELA